MKIFVALWNRLDTNLGSVVLRRTAASSRKGADKASPDEKGLCGSVSCMLIMCCPSKEFK